VSKKTCFVISPIGEANSAIRQHADDFLELLVEQALSKFGFRIVRADKIPRASTITNDIIEHVQQADLCIVDLTFQNPNVFYECGRRHETGKPTIQLIMKGEKLPFDVAGIRTLEYDLTDPRTTHESIKQLTVFIEEIDAANAYSNQSSGVSLATIATTLARIEQRIIGSDIIGNSSPGTLSKRELIRLPPHTAFSKALDSGDISSAKFVLPRIRQFLGESQYISALSVLAESLDEQSKNELQAMIPDLVCKKQIGDIKMAIDGIYDFYSNSAASESGIDIIENLIQDVINDPSINAEDRAFLLNELQKLKYESGRYAEALIDCLKLIELVPEDSAYWYNLALNQEKMSRINEAADSVEKFLALDKAPKQHLLPFAQKVLSLAGRNLASIGSIK